jgi:hypothetical protein
MADGIVLLSKSYTAHETTFDRIVLREPTYKEIFMDGHGKPEEWQMTKAGPVRVVHPAIVDAYVQELIVEPGYDRIGRLNAIDSLKLEREICDFFLVSSGSTTSSTGSSSRARSKPRPPKE